MKIPVFRLVQQSRKTTKYINQRKWLYKDMLLKAGILLTVRKGKLQLYKYIGNMLTIGVTLQYRDQFSLVAY